VATSWAIAAAHENAVANANADAIVFDKAEFIADPPGAISMALGGLLPHIDGLRLTISDILYANGRYGLSPPRRRMIWKTGALRQS
jgi:hypothetical protein